MIEALDPSQMHKVNINMLLSRHRFDKNCPHQDRKLFKQEKRRQQLIRLAGKITSAYAMTCQICFLTRGIVRASWLLSNIAHTQYNRMGKSTEDGLGIGRPHLLPICEVAWLCFFTSHSQHRTTTPRFSSRTHARQGVLWKRVVVTIHHTPSKNRWAHELHSHAVCHRHWLDLLRNDSPTLILNSRKFTPPPPPQKRSYITRVDISLEHASIFLLFIILWMNSTTWNLRMCIEVGCDFHLPLCGASERHFGHNIALYCMCALLINISSYIYNH